MRDALELDEVRAGEPDTVAGARGLDREVRWAHVVAGADAAQLLDGGELVLTTGAGWPEDTEALAPIVDALIAAGPAGILLELGAGIAAPPAPLIDACEQSGVPLIALHREVRFVQITQRLHQRMLTAQNEALEARAEVHDMLTELGLNRSPVDYVVERLADTLRAPVVLEDSAHRVVAWSGSGAAGAGHALDAWASGSALDIPDQWDRVHVEAQGKRWGRLTALPGPAHPAGRRTVLELGAFAIALGRLADPQGEQWLQLTSKRAFDALLDGRYRREDDLAIQLAAAGLPVDGRLLAGITLRGVGDFGTAGPLERTVLETALRRAVAPEGNVIVSLDERAPEDTGSPALLALLSFPPGDDRAASGGAAAPPLAKRLDRELGMLLPATTPRSWHAHLGLGTTSSGVRGLIASLEQVRAGGRLDPSASAGRVTVQQVERQPLAHLVRGLAAMPEMQEFAGEVLGPLVAHDAERGPGRSGDLLQVLRTYLKHPSNRSLAAQEARLSRSVFYQRIALIERLLGVDLADGETLATLTVALLARG